MERTCVYCGQEVEQEPEVGWVAVASGDDGGTYDICPENGDLSHDVDEEA